MTLRTLGIASFFALAVASCNQQPADDSNIAIDETVNAAEAANAEVETLPPDESAGAPGNTGNAATPASAAIPAQYHGRWGMVANDCDPKRSDAKGLITIDATMLRFYESRATLKEQRPAIATSFAGLFAFTGEGMNWEKVETFTRNGDTLKRADDEGSYSYKRCA